MCGGRRQGQAPTFSPATSSPTGFKLPFVSELLSLPRVTLFSHSFCLRDAASLHPHSIGNADSKRVGVSTTTCHRCQECQERPPRRSIGQNLVSQQPHFH